ncbi:STAS domain-containing protein [Streptomyces sp. 5-8]|uniref:Anti-sigma factor antagonist n=1 Tax=Streptomyces musisoli TaxID=2802280 RepID=A0ABS1NWT2_9ACTN|nr:STAS domain-containing protein [Streptomyces musisoli]MBY8844404.1 STAS domain-containing protein [Streptomyces sp. SP2-10]
MDEARVTDTADTNEQAEPEGLSVIRSTVDGVAVVTVTGEVDHHTSGVLRDAIAPAHPTPGARTVADLSGVPFMDSSGINVLIAGHQAHAPAGWLRLAGVQRSVLRTLEIVGLTPLIACYPSVRDAIED